MNNNQLNCLLSVVPNSQKTELKLKCWHFDRDSFPDFTLSEVQG
jgi:hypothetical protein